MEPPVGAFWHPLTRKHAYRVLFLTPIRIDTRRVRIGTGQIFLQQERQQVTPATELGDGQFGHHVVTERVGVVIPLHLLATHQIGVLRVGSAACTFRPSLQQLQTLGADLFEGRVVGLPQAQQSRIAMATRNDQLRLYIALQGHRARLIAERAQGFPQALGARGCGRSLLCRLTRLTSTLSNLCQITHAFARHQCRALREA